MKKIWIAAAAIGAIIPILAACSAKPNTAVSGQPGIEANASDLRKSVASKFEGCITPREVDADVTEVDLMMTMDTKGLKSEEVVDEENGTKDVYYKDSDGKTVYIDHIGYGEDTFTYFAKSTSGKDLEILFEDEDGERVSALVKCDDYYYSIGFGEANENYNITVYKNDCVVRQYVSYVKTDTDWSLTDAMYYADDGIHKYVYGKENGKTYEDDWIISSKTEPVITDEASLAMMNDRRALSSEFIYGQHSFSYSVDDEGKETWYVTAEVKIVFNSKIVANGFAEENGLVAEYYEDDCYFVNIGRVTFEMNVSDELISHCINEEIDDYYYVKPVLDENNKLTEFARDTLLCWG